MNLRNTDLNLLVLFEVLVREQNITRAAQQVGLSQSAMSNALNRLRDLFQDEVLVRSGIQMVPTPKALALLPDVQEILSRVGLILESNDEFNPAESNNNYVILTTDYCEFVVLPKVVERIRKEAPNVTLEVKRMETDHRVSDIFDRLENRDLDLVILSYMPDRLGINHYHLFSDRMVSMAKLGHPLAERELSVAEFLRAKHLGVKLREDKSHAIEDTMLSRKGQERDIAVSVPHYMVAPWLLINSDLIVTVPQRAAAVISKILPLSTFQCPVFKEEFAVNMMWHHRFDNDPSHCWFREQFIDLKQTY